MLNNPLVQDLIDSENLSESQAAGAVGLVLSQLRTYLEAAPFALIQKEIPDCDSLIAKAPTVKSSLLGGLANSLGGKKAKALMELNKGLHSLGIPTDRQRSLGETLKRSVETHYPDLVSLIDLG